jgi:hypothetical protein
MGAPGGPKTGGRQKGTPNKVSAAQRIDAIAIAEQLECNPFEVILNFVKGDWRALGYQSPTKTLFTAEGTPYEVDVITPEMRLSAAKEATQYLIPKKKALEISGDINLELARKAEEFAQLTKEEQIVLMKQELQRLESNSGS